MSDYVLRGLDFSYKGKTRKEPVTKVFENLCFEFDQGDTIFLSGQSGEGKTTLLKILAGLLDPDEGSLKFRGEEILDIKASSRDVAFCFQEAFLYPFLTVYGNLYAALDGYGLKRMEKDKLIKEIIKGSPVAKLLNFKPKELSLGQKETVALYRALVRKPSLFLADEPFSGVDVRTKDALLKEMFRLVKNSDTTLIYVGHDVNESRHFDRHYRLEGGKLNLVADRTTKSGSR